MATHKHTQCCPLPACLTDWLVFSFSERSTMIKSFLYTPQHTHTHTSIVTFCVCIYRRRKRKKDVRLHRVEWHKLKWHLCKWCSLFEARTRLRFISNKTSQWQPQPQQQQQRTSSSYFGLASPPPTQYRLARRKKGQMVNANNLNHNTINGSDSIRFDWIIIMADYDMFSMETVKHETGPAMCGHTIASQRKFVWFVIWTSQIYLTFVVRYRSRIGCLCRIVGRNWYRAMCVRTIPSSVAKTSIFCGKNIKPDLCCDDNFCSSFRVGNKKRTSTTHVVQKFVHLVKRKKEIKKKTQKIGATIVPRISTRSHAVRTRFWTSNV